MDNCKNPKNRMKKRWLLLGVIGIVIVLFLFSGGIPFLTFYKSHEKTGAPDALPHVIVMQAKANTAPIEIILPSSAQAWHETPIWAKTNGYLTRYYVDIDDEVMKGDLLAEIDTPEIHQQYEQAESELLQAISQLEIAKSTSDRWQQLWEKDKDAVTKQEVDQFHAKYALTEAAVFAHEKNVAKLKNLLEFNNVYAPFDGTITQRNVDVGSLIYENINGSPQELFQIAETKIIRFFVDVPQNYFNSIREGVKAHVTVSEIPDRSFRGIVTRFAKELDPNTQTRLIEVDVENYDGELYAGLNGKVEFLVHSDTNNFIIPTTALVARSPHPYVALVDEKDIVHYRNVQIGQEHENEIEVISGLNATDRIIISSSDQIQEGSKVIALPQH